MNLTSLKWTYPAAFFLLLLGMFSQAWSPSPVILGKKHAFIIAIGDYPRVGGWPSLSSARDVEVLTASLHTLQFDEIRILSDKDATKAGITSTFENEVIPALQPGDILLLHYSGHGQQISEKLSPPSLIEDELDGYDEALVPYDARDEFRPGVYEGENHLTDDELHLLLQKARTQLGPNGQLVFSVDACYSGTINRDAGLVKTRGTTKKFSPEQVTANAISKDNVGGLGEFTIVEEANDLAGQVVISASRADQPNYETTVDNKSIGSLSYALSKNLTKLRPNQSFEALFRQLRYDMEVLVPNQSPQIEGDVDKQVFGSASLPTLGLQILRFEDDYTVILQAGTLAGLQAESGISLKSTDGQARMVSGKVVSSTLTESRVRLTEAAGELSPGHWQVIVNQSLSLAKPVRVFMNVQEPGMAGMVRSAMASQERLELVTDNAELLVIQRGPGNPIELHNSAQEVMEKWSVKGQDPNRLSNEIVNRIQKYSRAQYLRTLNSSDDVVLGVGLDVVPVSVEQAGNVYRVRETGSPLPYVMNGHPSMNIGDYFVFNVKNNTSSRLFFTVVGVSSDDEVFTLVPDDQSNPEEFVIEPNSQLPITRNEYIFQIAEPRGLDTYLVLASSTPMDLRPVFRQPDVLTRSSQSQGARDFHAMVFGKTRSAFVSPGQLAVGSVTIKIQ